jgi:hypothetical protein
MSQTCEGQPGKCPSVERSTRKMTVSLNADGSHMAERSGGKLWMTLPSSVGGFPAVIPPRSHKLPLSPRLPPFHVPLLPT